LIRAEQRRGFQRAQPLFAQRFAQRVHLEHHVTERVVAPDAARAHGKILFAQSREQIGNGLQRMRHAFASGQRKAKPAAQQQHRQRPLRP